MGAFQKGVYCAVLASLPHLLVIIFNLRIYDKGRARAKQADNKQPVLAVLLGAPAGHEGTRAQLGGQMRLLAISHLALTMQFPLNCKVHTANCEGGSASGDMLKTIVEGHTHTDTHRHKETQSLRHSLHSFVFPVAVGGPSCCLFAELLSSVVTSATQAAIKD